MRQRIITNWVYGGTMAGLLLLMLAPLILEHCSPVLTATYLLLPAYMLHQLEEHDDDRFRRYVNTTLGSGAELLSPAAVFVINVPGVWGVLALALLLTRHVHPGCALVAVYLVLVNAVLHLLPSLAARRYNPGLGTALLLFAPLGGGALRTVQLAHAGTPLFHTLGFLSAVGIHAVIIAHVRHRQRHLRPQASRLAA